MKYHYCEKFAFTLAEVLITLGIIGVVAAMTLPSLISNHQKNVVETSLKKSYSILSQMLQRSELENGDAESWTLPDASRASANEFFMMYFYPYLNIVETQEQARDYNRIFTSVDAASGTQSWYYANNHNSSWYNLADGTSLSLRPMNSFSTGINVVLPCAKNKERLIVGKDVFNFTLRNYGNKRIISAFDYPQIWSCDMVNNTNRTAFLNRCKGIESGGAGVSTGSYCSALIYCNGWKIPDDYPIKF